MLKNLLITAFRNLRKHRFHTGLNVFGLSLGISCAWVLFQFINYHQGFDTYHHNARNLYRVVTDLHLEDGTIDFERGAPVAFVSAFQAEVPEIKNEAALLRNHSMTVAVPGLRSDDKPTGGNNQMEKESVPAEKIFAEHENTGFADRHWFELFDYQWQAGNAATALETPNTAVITASLAKKYFGNADPVGRLLKIDGKQQVVVTGILADEPPNTDFKTELFLSLSSYRNFYPDMDERMRTDWQWINSTTSLFVMLPSGGSPESINTAMKGIAKRSMGWAAPFYQFHLQPLKEVHFDGRYSGAVSRSLLATLALIALFLVLIACINFINLATVQQAKRAREIGTRKVLGSGTAAIFWQFMTETAFMVALAALGSVFLLSVCLHGLNNWLKLDLGFHFIQDVKPVFYFILLLVLVTGAAGFYPALVLSRVGPIAALKNATGSDSGRPSWQRKGLILLQNSCAQLLIICTLIMTMQMNHVKNADLGFNKDAVVMVPIPDTASGKLTALRNGLLARSDIGDLSFCFLSPSSGASYGGTIRYDDREWEKFAVRATMGDSHYLHTFGLRLLAGRNLQESDTVREFLINEELVHKLGYNDPHQVLGHRLLAGDLAGDHPGIIVGVIRNFYYGSLFTGIEPVEISTQKKSYKYAAIKLSSFPHGGAEALTQIGGIWKSVYPGNVFEYHFLNDQIESFYGNEDLLNKLIAAAAAIAIGISCLGLLGLISLLVLQRTKEIGIRKVAGASENSIVVLLSKDFLQLVMISIVIASPIALLVMNAWLQHFAYRIAIPAWIFVVSGMGGMCIALLTIGFHALRAARASPVIALRSE